MKPHELIEVAALMDAALICPPEPVRISVAYRVKAVSPGAALATASRIADALGVSMKHDPDNCWFTVGDDHIAVVWYDEPEVAK